MDPGRDLEFAEFVDGRFTALQRFGYLLTGEWHLAEDLVQTSLTKVWFHRNSLRSGNALESYTRTVMVNTSTQWWRRKWKGETPTEYLPEPAAPSEYGVVDDRDLLLRALATLPRRTRATLVLRYFEDLPEAEIAQIMGCSVGTVKSNVSRGLAKLREHHLVAAVSSPAQKEG
ncbi:SigE family RNA polymerase sigma factor [Kribbella solani]|uniref:RNA polymerase sigma-70 factor (Sigma-E family) n=1 Tax=Kribbella solani TaxID=236067 RepID=A0A841E876_9ACTN|nr:SigE family RNA polymerase sigma factor [Kribbella solani]MBB5983468.1 RNA polymerase sigma-70 factor (sigma-E family) [Kribbella solani]MDX2971848.1 SigE family RNA polymerase sigma factor [Kribbella solani]MDX3006964.1 SigE family RNA polymerase sigma factor [Kribbella solani]